MIKNKLIYCNTIGKVYNIYNKKNIFLYENFLITQYISIDKTLRHHIIMNNNNVIGVLFIRSNSKFHVITLSHAEIDRHINGTIAMSPTQYVPIKLPDNSLQDIITLVDYSDKEDLSLFKAKSITLDDDETAPFIVTK